MSDKKHGKLNEETNYFYCDLCHKKVWDNYWVHVSLLHPGRDEDGFEYAVDYDFGGE